MKFQPVTCAAGVGFPLASVAASCNATHISLESIRQTLGLFPIAIDSKQYGLLSQVFTPSATASFTEQPIQGLGNITLFLTRSLAGLTSQHELSSLYINQTASDRATSTNYLQGNFFGEGDAAGQYFLSFGYYQDELVRVSDPGCVEQWRVQNRLLVPRVCLYDQAQCPNAHLISLKGTIGNSSVLGS